MPEVGRESGSTTTSDATEKHSLNMNEVRNISGFGGESVRADLELSKFATITRRHEDKQWYDCIVTASKSILSYWPLSLLRMYSSPLRKVTMATSI